MADTNFNSILDETIEKVERAPMGPKGTYVWVITGLPQTAERGDWDIIDIPVRAVRPTDDVDADELAEFGEAKNITTRHSFLFDKNDKAARAKTKERLERFLFEHLGIPLGMSIKQALNESVNKQFLGVLDYREDEKTGDQFYRMGRTAPVA